jgi:hypothetical protein
MLKLEAIIVAAHDPWNVTCVKFVTENVPFT